MSRGYRVWDKISKVYLDNDHGFRLMYLRNGSTGFFNQDKWIFEQDTGLLDRNGKKIYEGDILETCCGRAEVYFDDEVLMYKIKVRHGGTMPLVGKKSKRHFDYEIIGNVHQNKELLGGKK